MPSHFIRFMAYSQADDAESKFSVRAFIRCKHATRKNKFRPSFSYGTLRVHKHFEGSMQSTFTVYPSK